MNQQQINNTQLKILPALQHISEDAQQWKENEKMDLDNTKVTTKTWEDWDCYNTQTQHYA